MKIEEVTFACDKLNRKPFVENIMNVIDRADSLKSQDESLVLAMDSAWGTGKSYLINMWKNWLLSEENEEKNYAVTYYNAWEEDDCENAFFPLVYQIQDINVANKDLSNQLKGKAKEFLKECGIALFKDAVKNVIGEETSKIINEGIDKADKEKIESIFDKYHKFKQEKEKFRKALEEMVPDNGKLIVFIDELDRCRPDFAIETLEVVKHYFNIKNIVFIFSVDLEQLSHSVSTIYGQGMNSEGYLIRFFDFKLKIPEPDLESYTKELMQPIIEEEFFEDGYKLISNVYKKLDLSLREVNKITNNFIVFYLYYKQYLCKSTYRNENDERKNKAEVYLYFMVLKYKYPEIYNIIRNSEFVSFDKGERCNNSRQQEGWKVLDARFYIDKNIKDLLAYLQAGMIGNRDSELISKFGIEINCGMSFSSHIEKTLEMFT